MEDYQSYGDQRRKCKFTGQRKGEGRCPCGRGAIRGLGLRIGSYRALSAAQGAIFERLTTPLKRLFAFASFFDGIVYG